MLDLREYLDFSPHVLELVRVLQAALIVYFYRNLSVRSSVDCEVHHCVRACADFFNDFECFDRERAGFHAEVNGVLRFEARELLFGDRFAWTSA